MTWLSAQAMSGLLTAPYQRGAEIMEVPLGDDIDSVSGRFTNIPAYPFHEYKARYGDEPLQPKYVVFSKTDVGNVEMQLEFQFSSEAIPAGRVVVTIPPRTFAGVSFVIPLPANADASLRLERLRQLPEPLPGTGAENWGVITLLGNISKLAWVLGREKDEIRAQLLNIKRQRVRAFAHGYSLDQLGVDLRVPRFPPREHSFDLDTLALYHLNEVPPAANAADETARFGLAGHPGIIIGAQGGAIGKFGTAFSFPSESSFATIVIENHADFNIAADSGFTAEAFVKVESVAAGDPRVVLMKRPAESVDPLPHAGWSISLGAFRGIPNNVMWTISDGVREFKLFADINLADSKFHHLAAIVDRAAQRTRLFVDGEELASASIDKVASAGLDELGAVVNDEFVRIGRSVSQNQFVGVIDEVRFSKIARTDFHPVLGESDEAYRLRLGIFEQWLLPTPGNLLTTINDAVRINGEPDSFVLIENDRPSTVATKVVRILPKQLEPGQTIDRDGGARSESEISGAAAADQTFNEIYLLRHDRSEVNYLDGENSRRMQAPAKVALDALLDLLAQPATPGKLVIRKSFDPAVPGLHSLGRALRLTHETLALNELAALVHKAGFDFVRNEGSEIYASVAAGDMLAIVIEPRPEADTPPPGSDVFSSKPINLHVAPETLPVNGEFNWTLITCDAGRAHFEAHPDDEPALRTAVTSRRRLRLVADAPGEVTLRVEYTLARRTVSATRTILIGIESLPDNRTIAGNGDMQIRESVAVGTAETEFNPIYLISSNAPVSFVSDDTRRMQIVLERPFLRLVKLLQEIGAATIQLRVLAINPASPGLHRVGRAMRLRHNVLDPGVLGALAHRAGFGFVRRNGSDIFVAVAAGEEIEIVHSGDQTPLGDEVELGRAIKLQARFQTLPPDGEFNWSTRQIGNGKGSMNVVLQSETTFTPTSPGLLALSVTFLEPDTQSTFPYTFEIRLKSALDVPGTNIPKHQYDLLMNVLNYFHPIGVEILTRNIREHVVEVQGNLLNAFPGYTYPDFRA